VGDEPVVLLHAPREVIESLRPHGWHGGFDRDPKTGYDVKLPACFREKDPAARRRRLAEWLQTIQSECVDGSLICTVWHPDAALEDLKATWKGPVVEIAARTAEEAALQLPPAWRERLESASAARLASVVLLRSPRAVMEALQEQGFHSGYWRDGSTGRDRGLTKIFAEMGSERREAELKAWFQTLDAEARRDGKVVAVWHPGVSETMLRAVIGPRRLLAIEAETTEEALAQWHDR